MRKSYSAESYICPPFRPSGRGWPSTQHVAVVQPNVARLHRRPTGFAAGRRGDDEVARHENGEEVGADQGLVEPLDLAGHENAGVGIGEQPGAGDRDAQGAVERRAGRRGLADRLRDGGDHLEMGERVELATIASQFLSVPALLLKVIASVTTAAPPIAKTSRPSG